MLFRLINALATFQKLINNILRVYLDIFIIVYLDNILIYSKNKEDYIKYIYIVLRCLDQYNLRVKLEKCKFYKKEVNFLSYVVEVNKVYISKEKIKVVKEQLTPKIVKDI